MINAGALVRTSTRRRAAPGRCSTRITDPAMELHESLLYYLLLDPAAPGRSRSPSLSTRHSSLIPPAGRILAHSDWTSNATMFDYRASWISINHQDGDGGQFEFYPQRRMAHQGDEQLRQQRVWA